MKKLLLLASIWLAALCPAHAQNVTARVVPSCAGESLPLSPGVTWLRVDQTGVLCTSAGGGGGGGLSVTDAAAWTQASSSFTPTGGVFNDSATALVSGHQGTVRLNANREMHVTCDTGNTLCAAIQSPVPTRAQTQEQTAVSNGTTTPAAADATGKVITLPYANPENFLDGTITTAMTGTTDTVLTGMDLQGGSFRVYVTGCTVSNSHATQGTDVVLKNGSAGTVLWTFPAAPAFGGATMTFPTPLKTSANTGLYAANITTGSNTKISCTGYKGV